MEKDEKTINKVYLLDVDLILPNPAQPRRFFDPDQIKSLAESIKQNGLLQPITVRRNGDFYELISGERRLRALKLAGIKKAPSIIVKVSDTQSAVFALLENLQREDLSYFEEALSYKQLLETLNISQKELGVRLAKAQSTIANKLRLLSLSEQKQRIVSTYDITERQCRALLPLKDIDDSEFEQAVKTVSTKRLNTVQTESFVQSYQSGEKKRKYVPVIKDARLFVNSINHVISLINKSNTGAVAQKRHADGFLEYLVRIPLKKQSAETEQQAVCTAKAVAASK